MASSDSHPETQKMAGDFPMVLFEVISKRSNVMEGTLTIDRLNNLLDELSKAGGKMFVMEFVVLGLALL